MAGHEENNGLAISYMMQKHSRCCCQGPNEGATDCVKCKPVQQICCLLAWHSSWVKKLIFVRAGYTYGDEANPCDDKGTTHICGKLYSVWPYRVAPCMPVFILQLIVNKDCTTVTLGGFGHGSSTLPRDWWNAPLVIPNPIDGTHVTFEPCPETIPEAFTEEETTTAVTLQGYQQAKTAGVWVTNNYRATAQGVCICGNPIWCPGVDPFSESRSLYRIYWRYDLYTDKTIVWVEMRPKYLEIVVVGQKEFDGSGCEWTESAFFITHTTNANLRWFIEPVEDCTDAGGGPPDPCDPGCWPECAMCPTRKSMAVVVTPDPSCCASGSVGLTYEEENNRWALASPHSFGPTCSTLLFFRMTCSGETSVTFNWKYRNTNGDEIERTDTVAVTCSEDGDFETAAVSIATNLITPGLCTTGTGKGANVRVISV